MCKRGVGNNRTMVKKRRNRQWPAQLPIGQRHAALLNAICHANIQEQRALLRTSDESLVKCICECALNVLHGVVKVKPSVKKRLSKFKNVLRQLAPPLPTCTRTRKSQNGGGKRHRDGATARKRRKFNWRAKKRLMMQKGCGAFLPLLLAPIITGLFSRLFGGNGGGSSE